MKQELYVHIPTPCHEDWSKMTPESKGRFCASCAKTVVDFSVMTDNDVLNFLNKNTGNLCGRFAEDQLQRPLIETQLQPKKGWKYWLASISSLVLMSKSMGQKKQDVTQTKGEVAVTEPMKCNALKGDTIIKPLEQMMVGKIACRPVHVTTEIKGTITDEKNIPLAGASVMIKGATKGVVADYNGNFSIKIDKEESKAVTLVVSYVGYKRQEVKTDILQNKLLTVKLTAEDQQMGDVVVLGGMVAISRHPAIKGKVVNEQAEAVSGVSIVLKGSKNGVASDSKGNFSLYPPSGEKLPRLLVSSIGFETKEVLVDISKDPNPVIILKKLTVSLQEVVVTGYNSRTISCTVGGMSVHKINKVKRIDTLSTTVASFLGNEKFTVYPNPAPRNGTLQLSIKEAGDYEVQMLDNQSKLLYSQHHSTQSKTQAISVAVPANALSGMYFIRLINDKTKKQSVSKVVVE